MPTLLMRLEAPMQSYGVFGRFGERDTGKEPSKSAALGLICSALGIDRAEDISWLSVLKFGLRVDKEGIVRNDYHIAGKEGYHRAAGNVERKTAIPTNRYYLADASFLVGIESDDRTVLEKIQSALHNPKWLVFLGKKSFVPSLPLWIRDGVTEKPLLQALKEYPFDKKYLGHNADKRKAVDLRYVVDKECITDEEIIMVSKAMDVPVSFERRLFGERETATLMIPTILEEE